MGGDADRHRLRATSDEAPELYDRARAPYPPNLLADFVTLANLREARRLLEIGCGTGLATVPLAGPGLEIVGRAGTRDRWHRLRPTARGDRTEGPVGFTNVRVVTAAFESWEPPSG